MSVTTETGRTQTPSLLDGARAKVGQMKQSAMEEMAGHALRAATSENVADFMGEQLDEAQRLNQRKYDHEFLSEHESERRDRKRRARVNAEDRSLVARAGQNVDLVGLAIALVIVGVVAYVGLAVMSTTEQSTSLDNDSEFQNASTDLTSGISDAYGLMGILFLVLILTGVVGLLLGLRGRRR